MGMDTYPPQLETGKGGSDCLCFCVSTWWRTTCLRSPCHCWSWPGKTTTASRVIVAEPGHFGWVARAGLKVRIRLQLPAPTPARWKEQILNAILFVQFQHWWKANLKQIPVLTNKYIFSSKKGRPGVVTNLFKMDGWKPTFYGSWSRSRSRRNKTRSRWKMDRLRNTAQGPVF